MRILIKTTIFIIAMLSPGCAPTKISTHDNYFSSSKSPEIIVTFPKQMKYLGEINETKKSDNGNLISIKHFIYVKANIKSEVSALGQISILDIKPGYWLTDFFTKNSITLDFLKIDGNYYQAATWVSNYPETKFITDHGLIIPRRMMIRGLGRLVDSNQKKNLIYYAETVPDIETDNYYNLPSNWNNKDLWNEEQKRIFRQFCQQSTKCCKNKT